MCVAHVVKVVAKTVVNVEPPTPFVAVLILAGILLRLRIISAAAAVTVARSDRMQQASCKHHDGDLRRRHR